jgi:hypothetical protein
MENALASGEFHVICYDKDGNLKWEEKNPNLVMNYGLQYMVGNGLTNSATKITAWYIGLTSGTGTYVATDTIATHTWTEFTSYSGNRKACTFAAATAASPSVATNSASVAVFAINAGGTVLGAFLCDAATGSTYPTVTLFSASNFTGGSRTVVSGDTLNVTYTFSLTATP